MITHAYPRRAGDVAGAFLARLATALARRGHGVTVVAPSDRGEARRFSLDGVDVVQVRYAAPERENLAYTGAMAAEATTPSGIRALWSLFGALGDGALAEAKRQGGALLHAHWWIPGGVAAVRTDLPFVLSLHGTDVVMLRNLPARLWARRVLGLARRVTAVSSFLASEARRSVWRADLGVDVVPLPVATPAFTRLSRGGGGIAVLGRLTGQKRVDLLLDAVKLGGFAVPVTIVGDGPARAALERRAADLGLSRVRFVGAVPPERVPEAVGDADLVAFVARHEGLGLAAAEALMLGIPVVATTDGGGILDIVRDGAWGRVVSPTPDAVAAGIRSVLGDGAARAAAATEGAALKTRLSPEQAAASFEAVYQRCA